MDSHNDSTKSHQKLNDEIWTDLNQLTESIYSYKVPLEIDFLFQKFRLTLTLDENSHPQDGLPYYNNQSMFVFSA